MLTYHTIFFNTVAQIFYTIEISKREIIFIHLNKTVIFITFFDSELNPKRIHFELC